MNDKAKAIKLVLECPAHVNRIAASGRIIRDSAFDTCVEGNGGTLNFKHSNKMDAELVAKIAIVNRTSNGNLEFGARAQSKALQGYLPSNLTALKGARFA